MTKVLRLYRNGNNNLTDWEAQQNYSYGSSERGELKDDIEASKFFDITSIPSPFARMQLVKDAFREVVKSGNLEAEDIYARTVSDTLDIGELFFNYDKFSDKLEIIPCDMKAIAHTLKGDNVDSRHQSVGDTLIKYLDSDRKSFNFDDMNQIYILRYIYGDMGMDVIGATSPRTLFFSTANVLTHLSDEFSFGQDKPFDFEFAPLYKRDFEYVKMWFYLRNTNRTIFAQKFPEINEYLDINYNQFDNEKRLILDNIQKSDGFTLIEPSTEAADHVEVLNISMVKKVVSVCNDSQFEINSKILNEAQRPWPLVLPVEAGINYSNLRYTDDNWGSDNKSPYYDELAIDKRKLPKPGNIKQPYLTISDFLEDFIVKVPHRLNEDSFFNGNIVFRYDEKQMSYLLPLKPRFFDYFTIDELRGVVDRKKMIELETKPSGGVRVTLRIPIRGNETVKAMVYSRTYYDNDQHDIKPVRDKNMGAVREFDFAGLVMPNYKFAHDEDAHYTLSCISMKSYDFYYHVYKGSEEIVNVTSAIRNPCDFTSDPYKAKNYSVEKYNFDFIQISDEERIVKSVIIPLQKATHGNRNISFAIDLGTSNTLIEYAVENSTTGKVTPTIFGFNSSDSQVCQMFLQTIETYDNGDKDACDLIRELELIEKDFLPQSIGKDSDYLFPTRTVLSAKCNIDWTRRVDPFSLVNIPMTYDKRRNISYNKMYFDIKWGQSVAAKTILEKYIDTLMIMIRNKVVLNNGNLANTDITWFYPISMDPNRQTELRQIWDNSYKKYINKNGKTTAVTESSAPVKAFYDTDPTASQIVSIDIGGGTTDMAFSKKKGEVSYVSSFRFATNDLFETPYSKVNNRSGIVDHFKDNFRTILESKLELKELLDVFDNEDNMDPANMASFLFSLKNNSLIAHNAINVKSIDFAYNLQIDNNFKIVFLFYYSSIIYHMAKIIKVANEGKSDVDKFIPRHITLSGNGSKIISTITPDVPGILTEYTKILLKEVADIDCTNLNILGITEGTSPKEATCKGGLLTDGNIDDRGKKVILRGTGDAFEDLSMEYNAITLDYERKVVCEVENFFNFMLNDMNNKFNFMKNFQINQYTLNIAKEVCDKNLDTFISKALDMHRNTNEEQHKQLEETSFFYPVKGVINALSTAIYNHLHSNE